MTLLLEAFLLLQVQPPADLDDLLSQAGAEQSAGRRTKAIDLYQRILAAPDPADPKLLNKYHFPRSRAQFQLAVCLEGESKHRDALEAYRKAETCPDGSSCGNSSKVAFQMGQGRCLEFLGRHKEAVDVYFKAAEVTLNGVHPAPIWRIADLFEAAGQTESLLGILDRRPKPQHRPTAMIRQLVEAREAGRLEQWSTLVNYLDAPGSLHLHSPVHQSPSVVASAHLLAVRPDKTVPLLQARLAIEPKHGRSWLYYSLGKCGTLEAVKTLKEKAHTIGRLAYQEEGQWELSDVCWALDLSEPGRAILVELGSAGIDRLNWAVEKVSKQSVNLDQVFSSGFPPVPKDARLN